MGVRPRQKEDEIVVKTPYTGSVDTQKSNHAFQQMGMWGLTGAVTAGAAGLITHFTGADHTLIQQLSETGVEAATDAEAVSFLGSSLPDQIVLVLIVISILSAVCCLFNCCRYKLAKAAANQ